MRFTKMDKKQNDSKEMNNDKKSHQTRGPKPGSSNSGRGGSKKKSDNK